MKMSYEEALELSFKVEWKVEKCSVNDCWCSMILPKEPIVYNENEELYIVGSGSINTEYAEHIVKLHNDSLK